MKIRLLWILLLAPFVFAGCGGGGGGGTTVSGLGGTGIVAGKIDGFGSILIANRKLTTDSSTEVEIEDEVSVWDDSMKETILKTGQIAFVEETNGHADSIKVDENVKGPVDSINPLVVMGQTVGQGAGTLVDNSCPASLLNAEVVEVFGLVDANGAIQANIIECKNAIDVNRYSIIGPVSGFVAGGNTFQINGLTVEITTTTDTSDLFGGEPQNGQLVQVKDDNKAYLAGSAVLTATKIEPQVSLGDLASPDQDIEIESIVTSVTGSPVTEFQMGDLTVVIPAGFTNYLFGTNDNIIVGVEVEVEGTIDSGGNLVADKIKFEDNDSRVDALVSAVDSGSGTITLLDGNVTVGVDNSTELEDGITLGNITPGDSLEVRGFIGSNGIFVASEVKTGSGQTDRAEIRSTASNLNATAGTLVILGITINTDNNTEFNDRNDLPTSRDAFFAALVENVTTVQAKWDPYSGDVSAPVKELELEDD